MKKNLIDVCSVDGCGRPVKVKLRGWCGMHYQRWLVHGDPTLGRVRRHGTERTLTPDGYIKVYRPGHPVAGKSGWAYEHRVVAYDAGILTNLADRVHHLDENKSNNAISNLQAMSAAQHALIHWAETGAAARRAARTHCDHGHPFDEENTLIRKEGGRRCRECKRARQARARART